MPTKQDGVTVITPTGGRPEAFKLCRLFMERQTYQGPLQWIIVDDVASGDQVKHCEDLVNYCGVGPDFTTKDWTVNCLFPTPSWKQGENTLARNILTAMSWINYEKIIFVEDDDWYSPHYLSVMSSLLDRYVIAGDWNSRYYHLPSRRFRMMQNFNHASLCMTAMSSEVFPDLEKVCLESSDFIDYRLWKEARRRFVVSLADRALGVGIKGLPGRPGIGVGHRPNEQPFAWNTDLNLTTLRSWISNDVELYEKFL